jgi:hypothetical protein
VDVQNLSRCCAAVFWVVGPCIVLEPIRVASRDLCTPLNTLYSIESPKLGFGFCLDYSIKNSFAVCRFVRPQLRELIIHLQFWLHSSLFLLVFFDSQVRISLLGEVRATPVDNLRRRGASIAGFGACCSEAGLDCVATPPNRELTESFRRSGTLVRIREPPQIITSVVVKHFICGTKLSGKGQELCKLA